MSHDKALHDVAICAMLTHLEMQVKDYPIPEEHKAVVVITLQAVGAVISKGKYERFEAFAREIIANEKAIPQ